MKSFLTVVLGFALAITSFGNWCMLSVTAQTSQSSSILDSLAKDYKNKGVSLAREENFQEAAVYFFKSLRIEESIPDFPKDRLARGYLNYANVKLELSYVDSAMFYYGKAEQAVHQMENPPSSLLGAIYFEKGNGYRYSQDYTNAIVYIRKGISVLKTDSIANSYRLLLAYNKLLIAYNEKGDNKGALEVAFIAFELAELYYPSFKKVISSNIASLYLKMNDYEKALHFYYIEKDILIHQQGGGSVKDRVIVYSNIANVYRMLGDNDRAKEYYLNSIRETDRQQSDSKGFDYVFASYAQFLMLSGDLVGAEEYFLKSLNKNSKEGISNDLSSISLSNVYSISNALFCFVNLGDIYAKMFDIDNDSIYPEKSLNHYNKAIEFIEGIRIGLFDDSDKLLITESYHNTYLKAIVSSFPKAVVNPKLVGSAFELSSKAKASVLNQAIAKERGLQYSGVPIALISKEADLRKNLGSLYELYQEARQKEVISTEQLTLIEGRIFDVQHELTKLVSQLENDYPNYYSLKFDTSSVSISNVQSKLSKSQVLIDYILVDSLLISFAVTKSEFHWKSIKINRQFYNQLKIFLEELTPNSFESLNRNNLDRYVSSSYFLYQHLLEPYKDLISGKEIVIVPHLRLSSIPFSALITSLPENPRGYYELPYVVLSNPVSYHPSAKLFYANKRAKPSLKVKSISFAPEYRSNPSNFDFSTMSHRQNLGDLPGAEKEAKEISNVFSGELVLGQKATELYFKESASNFDILHLAMHTFIDDENPLFSKLVFSNITDSLNDGLLNMYEVYGLNLNTKLAIISACRSSDGNLAKAEGILSLARGFQYAGCPSLVAAQWRVDDFSGSEVMVRFANNLKRGIKKSVALQESQIKFLQHADPLRSHPYFWASYQIIGDDSPLFYTLEVKVMAVLILLALIIICAFLVWKRFRPFTK